MKQTNPRPPIGQMLRVYRAVTGQEQKDLAKEIGLQPMTFSRIEAGKNVDQPTLILINAWMLGRKL